MFPSLPFRGFSFAHRLGLGYTWSQVLAVDGRSRVLLPACRHGVRCEDK